MARQYNFDLPYTLPYLYVGTAINELRNAGAWESLPEGIRYRMENAGWGGVEFSQEDCDSIDDKTWELIANRLNLDWSS